MNKPLIFLILTILSCKPSSQTINSGQSYGKTISSDSTINVDQLVEQLESRDSIRTKIIGRVESVCQVKGCWMNVVPLNGNKEKSIFVKFKDYGFFMPINLAGETVVMQGIAYEEVTTVDELKHYAEDEGLPQVEIDKIMKPKKELKFMAEGVIIN